MPTWASPPISASPCPRWPFCLFFLSSCTGWNDHHASVQCGCRSTLCHQCGQEHHVCHDTPLAGHLLPDAFHRLPARLHALCSLSPQRTVGITSGPLSHGPHSCPGLSGKGWHLRPGEGNFLPIWSNASNEQGTLDCEKYWGGKVLNRLEI